MKKLEIEKTKPSFIISVATIREVDLVFLLSNLFINKTAQERKLVHEKILTLNSFLALTEAGAYPQLPTQPIFFDYFQTYTAF